MADYNSSYTGAQIDEGVGKARKLPATTSADSGKTLQVNSNGDFVANTVATIPTIIITVSQVVSQDPLQIQLTDAQYNIFANNKQVIIDLSALNPTYPAVIWQYDTEDSDSIYFGFADTSSENDYYRIIIDKSTKVGVYHTDGKNVYSENILAQNGSSDAGKLLGFGSIGEGIPTNNLPILTTAPTAANTEGGIKIVILSSEPATKYSGYLYLITR